jgi:ATP dependent DNA ligase-like protein
MLYRVRPKPPPGFIQPCLPSRADLPASAPRRSPTSMDIPGIRIVHHCSPSPLNPLGVKGVGEAHGRDVGVRNQTRWLPHDGAARRCRRVRLLTRNGIDWTTHFAFIAEAAAAFRVKYFLIDGEAVCCDGDGMPVFDRLRYRRDDRHVFLYAFDVLQLDSQERLEPIEDRKAELAKLLRPAKPGLQLNEHMRAGRHRVSPRLQARVGRHRVQAGRLACPAARTIGSNARSRMRQW